MKLNLQREDLLKPLQLVLGAVEKRQTLPILSHVFISANANKLSLAATDLEVELIGGVTLQEMVEPFQTTVSARKLMDICRSLPEAAAITLSLQNNKLSIRSGKSRFSLSTLPAEEFPKVSRGKSLAEFVVSQAGLKHVLEKTHFAMAQQDVRYYLNGMLFDVQKNSLQTIATDGHRLALSKLTEKAIIAKTPCQLIVPRKGVLELIRLLNDVESEAKLIVSANHVHLETEEFIFTSKLVEGKFPDFNRVIPKGADKIALVDRDTFKRSLTRAAILCNEKYHSVRMLLDNNAIFVMANNPEQEEAEEEVEAQYAGPKIEIGFNVNYLLDVLNSLPSGEVKLSLTDANSSILVESGVEGDSVYVIMPMRL